MAVGLAARELGVSLDTLRRWDRAHRIRTVRAAGNQRLVPRAEIDRLLAQAPTRQRLARRGQAAPLHSSARNRLGGLITGLKVQGLLAEVVLQVGAHRVAALITAESCRALNLKVGDPAVAVIKASSVIIDRA